MHDFSVHVTVYGKTRPKSPGKILRKRGKFKKKKDFFSKDAPLIHFIHPKVQKYIQKCLKIAPNVIKINSSPKLQKYLPVKITFFQVFQHQHFKNVITHKIFEIL
jgi:hypothetical protein